MEADTEHLAEEKYLADTLTEIHNQLVESKKETKDMKSGLEQIQRDMWEQVSGAPNDIYDLDQAAQAKNFLDEINTRHTYFALANRRVNQLLKLQYTPYFGRMDFTEDSCLSESIYIGLFSLAAPDFSKFYIHDWRSPIAGMFYDFEPGRAHYECPDGSIEGVISLKRQYIITAGKLKGFFDCGPVIDDNILMEALSKNSNEKMQIIVSTIQREQNKAIRNVSHNHLLVTGPAGSGKTSVALHRVAWLLYRHRANLIPENILVISPNEIFNDYISNVLPELGEADIRQMSYKQVLKRFLNGKYHINDGSEQSEVIMSGTDDERIKSIRFKHSQDFCRIIKAYTDYLSETPVKFGDLIHENKCLVRLAEIKRLYHESYAYLPVKKRIEKLAMKLTSIVNAHIEARTKKIRDDLAANGVFTQSEEIRAGLYEKSKLYYDNVLTEINETYIFDSVNNYMKLFHSPSLLHEMADRENIKLPSDIDEIISFTQTQLAADIILHEDCLPIVFMKAVSGDIPKTDKIKHVIIDESQDYSAIQLELFSLLFKNAGFTLLGDPNQNINPVNLSSSNDDNPLISAFSDVFGNESNTRIHLSQSYRSTIQINRFCNKILGLNSTDCVIRTGQDPSVIKLPFEERKSRNSEPAEDSHIKRIHMDLQSLENEGFTSVAVVCINAYAAKQVHKKLSRFHPIKEVKARDDRFVHGCCVIPSYLTKGLEFDAVIVYDAGVACYPDSTYKNLFYTVCSRALHRLIIYCFGQNIFDI